MRTIIAGSREVTDPELVKRAVANCGWTITGVVSGCARGADTLGAEWALANGVPLFEYPADWDRYGKKAGMIRNKEMARYAQALIAIWDGESRGTKHMIEHATEHGLPVYVEPFS